MRASILGLWLVDRPRQNAPEACLGAAILRSDNHRQIAARQGAVKAGGRCLNCQFRRPRLTSIEDENSRRHLMLRQKVADALKTAMKGRDPLTVSTVRLILAKLKEQDIEARAKGNNEGIAEAEIQQMLRGMIKQRHDSIALYQQGGRPELAEKERGEIAIIERFLPAQLSDDALEAAVKETIAAIGAQGMKDMGRTMTALRERHAGQIDGARASQVVKRLLG
jgi:uncharacterized protein